MARHFSAVSAASLLIAFVVLLNCEVYAREVRANLPVIERLSSIKRYSYKLEELPSTFDPKEKEYQEGVIVLAAIFGVPSVLCLLGGLLFCSCRCCCNCCGGRKPSAGCCARRTVKGTITYSRGQRSRPRWTMYAVFLLAGCVMALAYWSNNRFTEDIDDFTDILVNTSTSISDEATQLVSLLTSAGADAGLLSEAADVVNNINDIRDDIVSVNDEVDDKYNKYRKYGTLGIFALSTAILGVGFICAVGSFGGLSFWILGIFGFLLLFLMGILAGAHFSLLVLDADFCVQVETLLDDPSAKNIPALQDIATCPDETDLDELQSGIDALSQQELDQLNTYCSGGCNPQFTMDNYELILNSSQLDESRRSEAEGTVQDLDDLGEASEIVTRFSECTFLRNMYETLEPNTCDEFLLHAIYLTIAFASMFLLLLMGTLAAISGRKRWKKLTAHEESYFAKRAS